MNKTAKIFLGVLIFLIVLFAIAYAAANSGYVFEKVASYFAPKYGIRYDKISGNALAGITIEGLYYHEKKLARRVEIKVNPATLLKKKITVSHLVLNEVNEKDLEGMIADVENGGEDNRSSPFPLSVRVNNIMLSMLPFNIAKIHFTQANLKLDSLEYTEDDLTLGTLRLMAKSSLGRADIKGHYVGRDLVLSDLYIGNLDSEEVEKILAGDHAPATPKVSEDDNKSESPSIFLPRSLSVERLKVTLLPRRFRKLHVVLANLDGHKISADLEAKTWEGDVNLTVITDVAKAELRLQADPQKIAIRTLRLREINASKILTIIQEGNSTQSPDTHSPRVVASDTVSPAIPFVPDRIMVDTLEAEALPFAYQKIAVEGVTLSARHLDLALGARMLGSGTLRFDVRSDLATLHHEGNITMNRLNSRIDVQPHDALITRYDLPLRKGALGKITVEALTDRDQANALVHFQAARLLERGQGDGNVDVHPSTLRIRYRFASGRLDGRVDAKLATPYTPDATLRADVNHADDWHFKGTLAAPRVAKLNAKLATVLRDARLTFVGNPKQFDVTLTTQGLKAQSNRCDFKQCALKVESADGLDWANLLSLPQALSGMKGRFTADVPLVYDAILPIRSRVNLHSNIANITARVVYDTNATVDANVTIPQRTLLANLDPKIRFAALNPMRIAVNYRGDTATLEAQGGPLQLTTKYQFKNKAIQGIVRLPGSTLTLSGSMDKTIHVRQKATSMQSLFKAISSVYAADLPDLSGDIALEGKITQLQSLSLTARSRTIRIGKNRKNATKIHNVSLSATGDKHGVAISHYQLEAMGLKLFANKTSRLAFKGDRVVVDPLWVNDALKSTGSYDLNNKKGTFASSASQLSIQHELADLAAALKLKTRIRGNRIALSGSIRLLGGDIKYDLNTKSFAADSDIIILQHRSKKQNGFQKNVAINIPLSSAKPLWYKKDGIRIAMLPHLTLKKQYGHPLRAYGDIQLLPGGYYTFQGKRFELQKSRISFRGKLTAPLLHIKIVYRSKGTTVRIKVSGTASDPALYFSSDPHMTRDQILSFIMFDTRPDSDDIASGDVTHKVASALVSSLFSMMGLKLDTFVINGSGFEVGKKLSDKITVIYTQQKDSSIKFKIQNTKNIETDISFGHHSRSADIFYKKEW